MYAKEVFWNYFQQTGSIGSYLLSKQLDDDFEPGLDDFIDDEEQD